MWVEAYESELIQLQNLGFQELMASLKTPKASINTTKFSFGREPKSNLGHLTIPIRLAIANRRTSPLLIITIHRQTWDT